MAPGPEGKPDATGGEAKPVKRGKTVAMNRTLHLVRFAFAWSINITLLVLACLVIMIYGVLFDAPGFTELCIAWVAGLVFTWGVIEPSEIAGKVLLPSLAENEKLMACKDACGELGFI